MKVLLVYPTNRKVATQPPLGLMYLAAVLKQRKYNVRIVEGNFETVKQLRTDVDVIGITCMTSQYHEIIKMRDYFHQWDIPLVFGGPHASILPETLLSDGNHFVDYVVVGEGERTFPKILENLSTTKEPPKQNNIVQGELTENLDSLPFPARDLVDPRYLKHNVSILASRGCPFNCSFCQPTLRKIFGKKIRRRSVSNVKKEMLSCYRRYDVLNFEFFDDTFTSDKDWVYKFCDEIPYVFRWRCLSRVDLLDYDLLKTMKGAGLTKLSIGFESGNQEVLNGYGKGTTVEQNSQVLEWCKKLKIRVHGFFMVGALNETKQTLKETEQFIQNHKFDTIFVTITMPMPCTRLYNQAKKEGKLQGDWRSFNYLGNMTTTGGKTTYDSIPLKLELANKELVKARYHLLKTFYKRKIKNPAYLWRFIRENGLSYTWNAAKNVLGG